MRSLVALCGASLGRVVLTRWTVAPHSKDLEEAVLLRFLQTGVFVCPKGVYHTERAAETMRVGNRPVEKVGMTLLHYFADCGRADLCRLTLAHSSIPVDAIDIVRAPIPPTHLH